MTTTLTPSRRTGRGRRGVRGQVGWVFVGPFVAIFLLVLIAPLVYAIWLSFFQDRLIGGVSFVGIANFVDAFTDGQLWSAIGRVMRIMAVQVPVMLLLALFCALAIDSARLAWAPFFRLMVFLPYAVPGVVAALMWGYIYGPRFGLVGDVSSFLGIPLPDPLGPDFVLLAIGNISTWLFTGYNMLVYISALKTIPTDLYEAAELDGAGPFRVIRSIKLPALRPAITITVMFSVIGSFQLFNEPNILRPLSPNVITSDFTPNMYAYTLSFAGGQYNSAATVAIVVGVLTMIAAYAVQFIGARRER
ncbi:sugar ABC transporter permease [Glaciibacter flavus]|uniref:Sugar ABC transporter permease n=1 Tax=Orlajensenia flava TaxID=2565934 RepID=A0A4S4FUN4_9MICO|nr:sugar ABC transporter permease [Glaciibacter flavus]THG33998.1 sugar ABC transporter permease [Glaciibacter flavus]